MSKQRIDLERLRPVARFIGGALDLVVMASTAATLVLFSISEKGSDEEANAFRGAAALTLAYASMIYGALNRRGIS